MNRWKLTLIYLFLLGSKSLHGADKKLIEESLRPKKLVLAIGVNNFNDELWRDLSFSGKDAGDVFSKFTSSQVGFDGGLLINSEALKKPLVEKRDIENALTKIAESNRLKDDTIVVYISTHGTVAYKEDGKIGRYIITSDTDPKNLRETAIDYDQFLERFNKLRSRKKVLILAFCHSGVGKSVLTPQMKRALANFKSPYFDQPIQQRSEGSIILTASGWREPALEDNQLKNDVYTHFLLDGFNQDKNGDGAVSITEAHTHASSMTYSYTKGRQRPSAIMELLGADPIIIKGKVRKTGRASLYSLLSQYANLLVSVDGKNMGSLEKGLVVPDGKVRLTLMEPETKKIVADRVVKFEAGREYSVANYLVPRLPHSFLVGARSFYFLSDKIRAGYASSDTNMLDLNYRLEEAYDIYDLFIRASYAFKNNETIEVNDTKVGQERSMGILDVQLGSSTSIQKLTTKDRFIRTQGRFAAGISLLYIDRFVSNESFYEQSGKRLVPGLSSTIGIDMIMPYHLIKFGTELTIGAHQNFTDEGNAIILSTSGSIFLGTFW